MTRAGWNWFSSLLNCSRVVSNAGIHSLILFSFSCSQCLHSQFPRVHQCYDWPFDSHEDQSLGRVSTWAAPAATMRRYQMSSTKQPILHMLCSVIRELATKALHNLTPQAPDYMASTGKLCHLSCSPNNAVLLIKRDSLRGNVLRTIDWLLVTSHRYAMCFFSVGFSFAAAVAHGSGSGPPHPPRCHPGMCRDHTRPVQAGPSNQQVDYCLTLQSTSRNTELCSSCISISFTFDRQWEVIISLKDNYPAKAETQMLNTSSKDFLKCVKCLMCETLHAS